MHIPLPQVYELPFLVALDHRKESVVVAVRGTMSLQVRGPPWLAWGRAASQQAVGALPELNESSHEVPRQTQENTRTEDEEANPGL